MRISLFFAAVLFALRSFAADPVLWTPGTTPADFLNSAYATGAQNLWNIGVTGKGVSAAVVAAGFYADHEIFNGKILNNYSGGTDIHGTHVAGTVLGMTPDAMLFLDNDREADLDNATIFNNIVGLAQTYNIVAVNNSWGFPYTPFDTYPTEFWNSPEAVADEYPLTSAAVQNLLNAGVITVSATGNDSNNDKVGYPDGLPDVISVGALNQYGSITEFSNQYQKGNLFILAPGTDIYSASEIEDGVSYYENKSGTSMSSPHVTGAIALLSSGARNATTDEIVNALYQSADRINYNVAIAPEFIDQPLTNADMNALKNTYSLISRTVDFENPSGVSVDDWRYVGRIITAITAVGKIYGGSDDDYYNGCDSIIADTDGTGARQAFKTILDKLGGESELQYTDYGFLRVDNAYKYLTKLMSYSNGDTLIKGGAKTAGAMAKGFGNALGNHLSEASSQAFQRLDELPFREQAKAYRKMSPAFYSSAAEYAQINTSETNARAASRKTVQSSLWGEGFGSYTDYAGTINASPYTAKSGGVLFGYNHKANNGQHGIFGAWSHSKIDGDDGYSRGSNLSIGGHFNYNASKFFVNGVLSYNLGNANVEREILIPGVKVKYAEGLAEYYGEYREDLLSDMYYNATAVSISRGGSTRIAGGYDLIQSDGWVFGTRAASSLSFLRSSGFNEFGAEEFSLSLNSFNSWYFDINAGLEVSKQVHQNFLAVVKATVARGKGFGDNLTGKFQESAGEFDVPVEHINQVSIVPEASLSWLVTDNLTINASYSGRFGGDYKRHSGNLGLSVGF